MEYKQCPYLELCTSLWTPFNYTGICWNINGFVDLSCRHSIHHRLDALCHRLNEYRLTSSLQNNLAYPIARQILT